MLIRVILAVDKPKLQSKLHQLISQHDVIVDIVRGKNSR